jgi:AcrR family transcriptional regulator
LQAPSFAVPDQSAPASFALCIFGSGGYQGRRKAPIVELISSLNSEAAAGLFVMEPMSEIVSSARKKEPVRTRSQDPDGTKRNIIDVAMREFADNGLSGARIDEIAAKTDASKRMIYYYFGDKDGLYLRCLEEAYRLVRRGEAELELNHLSPVDALRRLVEFTFEHHNGHPDFIRMVMIENIHNGIFLERSEIIQELNATAIDSLSRIYSRGADAGVFRKGIEPLDLHWQISALCFFNVSNRPTFGRIFKKVMDSDEQQARLRDQVVDMVLRFVVEPADLDSRISAGSVDMHAAK